MPRGRSWRKDDLASRTFCAPKAAIKGRQPATEQLGDRDIPSVVAGEVVTQYPDALGERREWK